jgi:putative transposase
METGLAAQKTCSLSGEVSSLMDSKETQSSACWSNQESIGRNIGAGSQRERMEDSLDESSARPSTPVCFGEPRYSDKGQCERIQGSELTLPEDGICTTLETTIALDALILCKHCGKRIKRDDREIHRGTEHNIAKKTVKCKILELNAEKYRLLESEYANYQRYIRGDETASLYSATKQQADRFLRRLKKQNGGIISNDQPLILRSDVYKAETKLTPYWIRIPVSCKRGKLNFPIGISSLIPNGAILDEAKLLKVNGEFYVYLTIEKDIRIQRQPVGILSIDAGIHNLATTVNSLERRPRFYGKELRKLRAHFYHLRKTLQMNGAYEALKRIGDKESRITNDLLHKVSTAIVEEADKFNLAIVIGDLKGIRLVRRYSRGFMRKLNSFPFYKLFQMIRYKAQWRDIKVIDVSEAYTSQTCHHCHSKGLRVGGKFKCFVCGHEYNADYNGSYSIMNRGIGQALSQGLLWHSPELARMRHHAERQRSENLPAFRQSAKRDRFGS